MITVILLGVYLHRKAHLGKARKTMCQNLLAIQVPNFRVNSSVESLNGEGIVVNIFLISEVVLS